MSNAVHALAWLESVVPRVENPLPERIGIGFPFTLAGMGSVLGDLARLRGSGRERDRGARVGTAIGFELGALGYATALTVQLLSGP